MKRECQCPRARHIHGTLGAYDKDRCRCFPCRIAKHHATMAYQAGGSMSTQLIPAEGTRRRLQALTRVGYSARQIGEAAGLTTWHVQDLRSADNPKVSKRVASAIAAVYDSMWDRFPVGPTADAQRTKATKSGYLLPLAWDDDEIDDPAAEPHTPGNGTWDRQPCGTPAAARRHYRAGEPLCDACKNAARRQSAERKDVA